MMMASCLTEKGRLLEKTVAARGNGRLLDALHSYFSLPTPLVRRFCMRTIWLIWGICFFAVISVIAGSIYVISTWKIYGDKSKQIQIWVKGSNNLSPNGLSKFQICLWRIDLISRWVCIGLFFIFGVIEIVLFVLRVR